MGIGEQTQSAYAEFLRVAGDAKIILLHPQSPLRSLLMAKLLADGNVSTLYYALDVDDINLRDFLTGITGSLSRQHVTFGRQMNLLPKRVLDEPLRHMESILHTFIAELMEVAEGEFWLVLDEFDRADLADDVLRFVERLSHYAPARCKIVLNGRTLPRMPWLAMIAKRHAVILRDEQIERENLYGFSNATEASLKVLSLGPGYVFRDDYLVDHWEGHLPRLLLFFAMDRPEVTRNEICETFWPKLHINQAVNVFHVTKRRLHKAVGADVLAHDGKYYRVATGTRYYFDAFEFVELLLEGRHGEPDDPFEHWQHVTNLYRGPYLQGHNEPWIQERRDAYEFAYVEALENIARIWEERQSYELALHMLTRAIDTDFTRLENHLKLLRLYVRLGRRAEAVAHFRQLERWAKSKRRVLSSEIRQLFGDITA
ncbi:MAG: bacterial transcriptional activator domain-containing protein [Chloroflexi bacterium]|nr:bacterial transcriptional activator domain-containing protein [Chloroflexota bacterium]